MFSIDVHELIDAGWPGGESSRFISDPFRSFIRADDARARAVWAIIEKRQPKTPREENGRPNEKD